MVVVVVVEVMVMVVVVMVMVMVVVVVEGLAARCDHTARLPLPTASAPAADRATALSQLHSIAHTAVVACRRTGSHARCRKV